MTAQLDAPLCNEVFDAAPPPASQFGAFLNRLRENAYRDLDASRHILDLQGWMDSRFEPVISQMVASATGPVRILEVGSWKGLSASRLGSYARARADGSSVLCIDTWLGAPEFWTWGLQDPTRGQSLRFENGYPSVFYTFTRNMKQLGLEPFVIPFPISSDQGFDVLRHYGAQFDLIYIDGSHEENAALRDMENAWSVLAPGGMLFGDDYSDAWPGIISAVGRFVKERSIKGVADQVLWFVPKPQA